MLTSDEIENWNLHSLEEVMGATKESNKSLKKLGDSLDGSNVNLAGWGGAAADAWRSQYGKVRTDIDEQGRQSDQVFNALSDLYPQVQSVIADYGNLKKKIGSRFTIQSPGKVVGDTEGDLNLVTQQQTAQHELDELRIRATHVNEEIADELRAATGAPAATPGQMPQAPPTDPTPKPGDPKKSDPTIAAGTETPPDQLPLTPKDGQLASPTEANARHTGVDGGADYLKNNQHPSPLLAGLSADQWRQRLANFKPGDPLPDPRTPTGDKAIDSLANAAGQQNSTYAWGGNQNLNGPSPGHPDNGDGATQYDDPHRIGYDCGGLVRYSLEQGAGIDGFQSPANGPGTNLLDKSVHLAPVPEGISAAQPGDVLVYGEKGHQAFSGTLTHHTGIYIGNGFYISAPQSGDAVQTGTVAGVSGLLDVLRLNGR